MAKFQTAFSKELALMLGHPTSAKIVLTMLRDTRFHPLVALNLVYDYLEGSGYTVVTPEVQGIRYYTPLINYDVCGHELFPVMECEMGMCTYKELPLAETLAKFDNKGILYLELCDENTPTICYVVPEDKYYIKAPTLFFP